MSAQPSLAQKTLRGIGVSYGSAVITGAMQIATTSVVARMVAPHDFGVLAMAQLGVRFAGYFSQFGVGSALVQKRDLKESDMAAAQVLAVAAGALFSLAGVLLAPWGGAIFHSGEVVWVIRALAVTFLLTGFTVAPLNLLRRQLRFGVIAGIDLASYAVGYAAPCLIFALAGHGLWGLVAGNLGSALTQLVLLNWMHPVSFRGAWRRDTYGALLSYGSQISITGFMEYICGNMDSLAVGRYLGANALGLYTRAYNLAAVPLHMMSSAVARVLFPAFSHLQRDSARLSRMYKESLTLLFVLVCPIGFSLVPAAPHVVRLLLGPHWDAAVGPLAIFGILAPFDMAVSLPGIVLDATGTLSKKLAVRAISLLGGGVAIYLNRNSSISTIASLMVVTCVATFLGYHFLVIRQLRMPLISAFTPMFFGACAGAIPMTLIRLVVSAVNPDLVHALLIEGVILSLSYVLIIAFSPFAVINMALSRVLRAALGLKRSIPENNRSRCLALQLLATARADGAY